MFRGGRSTKSTGLALFRYGFFRGGLGVLAIKERGVADGADAEAVAFGGDFFAERGAGVAVGVADEAEFHEFVGAEGAGEFAEKRGREAVFADFERRFELLAEGAEFRFLRAGERSVFHVGTGMAGAGADGNEFLRGV